MKNKYLYIICAIFFLIVLDKETFSQENNCPEFQIVGDYNTNKYTVIYPIGWSEDGIFAYIHQDINPLGSASIYHYEVRIENLRTGNMKWVKSFEYNFEDNPDLFDQNSTPIDTTYFGDGILRYHGWPDNYDQIEEQLTKYKIIQQETPISKIPLFLIDGIELIEDADYNPENTYCIISYMIRLSVKNKLIGRVLYEYKQKDIEGDECTDMNGNPVSYHKFKITGYFKSPYSELYVLYVVESTEGYEEPWEYPFLVSFTK